jgi:predicted DNA-binding transcriptional regulator YafY
MPRNVEVTRQWNILLRLEAARMTGASVYDLAAAFGATQRTIWRDMQALQEVGFPLRKRKGDDGRTYWMVDRLPLKALYDSGLSMTEICSLYMSRALLAAMPGAAFADGLAALCGRIEKALTPKMRRFLDELPGVVKVKPGARKKPSPNFGEIVARLIEACSHRKISTMRYYSASNDREKDYTLHPYHVAYADGGLYLTAFVPEYRQIRTFAVERIRTFIKGGRDFQPAEDQAEPFAQSLGVHRGRAERIVIEFAARVAPYIREREWHPSQKLETGADGAVRVTLKVCRDWALTKWVLGFGPHARVISPAALAEEIFELIDEARDGYIPRLAFESPGRVFGDQPPLPLS